ncbi:MAG TPA: CGNR zinc finger domain-containing protein [Candidatus Nitrosopolaris sp.]|nr:CGNR zinc finger domain-containing protein [Candidatus Nitrosopolaris sp.]
MADRDTAPGVLGIVQAFVNTVDLQDGPEEMSNPDALGIWLAAHELLEPGAPVSEADLRHAIAVREAIRGVIGGNNGGRIYPLDIATLNEASAASRLRARFGADGKARLEPEAGGVAGAMGRVVAAVFTAMADEHWTRLKLCGSPTCRWAFYDSSRNHSSRWCTMATCGNRQKARRFRERARSMA